MEIGKSYSLSANGQNGWAFTNWTSSQGWVSNNANLTFTMQSNLVLTANFFDATKPSLAITSPSSGQRLTTNSNLYRVRGTATDNAGVSNVWVRLNTNDWLSLAGASPWQVDVPLVPGPNTVWAYAVDAADNRSATNSVSFTYVVTAPLTVRTNGVGTVNPNSDGQQLEIGKSYSLSASPGTGQVFSNWTDAAGQEITNNRTLSFTMQSNLVLWANFVTNPFVATKGDYHGLFYPAAAGPDQAGATNCGYFKLSLSDQGSFSGSLMLEGSTLNFSGTLSVGLQAQVLVSRSGKSTLTMNVQGGSGAITGQVWCAQWRSELAAYRATTGNSPFTGSYTLLMETNFGATNSPPGEGAASVTVSASGAVQLSGTVADRSALSQNSAVLVNGTWPLFVSLYSGRGLLMAWMQFDTNQPTGNESLWLKSPLVPGDPYYTNGFAEARGVLLGKYTPPTNGQSAVNWRYGQLRLNYGELAGELTSYLVVTNNQVTVWSPTASNLTMTIDASAGKFSGSFKHPGTGVTKSFQGALLQVPGLDTWGAGWFVGTSLGGVVFLEVSSEQWPEDWVPASLNGKVGQLNTVGYGSSGLAFGNGLFQDEQGGAGSYGYSRLGSGKARVTLNYSTPPTVAGYSTVTDVAFTAAGTGAFAGRVTAGTNVGRAFSGTFTMDTQPDIVPASLSGHTVVASSTLGTSSIAFSGSSFTGSDDSSAFTGTYSYTKYTTAGGVVRLSYGTPPSLKGVVDYVEAWLLSPSNGIFRTTEYVPGNSLPSLTIGTLRLMP